MVNKRAQFFILSAVIIAAIIVGFVGIKNYAQTGQAPQKFYFYSEQLEKETGAVVDYALYSGSSNNLVEQFLQRGIQIAQQNNPGLEVYACYTNSTDSSKLICINNGTSTIKVKAGNQPWSTINGSQGTKLVASGGGGFCDPRNRWACSTGYCCIEANKAILPASDASRCYFCGTITQSTDPGCTGTCQTTLTITNEKNITMQLASGINYTIPINSPLIQSNQFYFIFQMNTSAGTYIDVSGDSLKGSSSVSNLVPPVTLSNS